MRFRLEDFSQKNLTQKMSLKGRFFALLFILPVTVTLLWVWSEGAEGVMNMHSRGTLDFLTVLIFAVLSVFPFFFARVTLKLLGVGQQERLISPYFYHPLVFFALAIISIVLMILGFVTTSGGDPKFFANQIKLSGAILFFLFMGFNVMTWWKK
jgi:hypothetical protein